MGTSRFSPYAVAESEPPTWHPGEDRAAAAFIGVCFYLFFDINVCIFRTFKKRKGLYFWSITLATWACLLDTIGISLKFLAFNSKHIWILYTIFLLTGWTIYAPAQLVVLYSRLHLLNENYFIRRVVLITIVSTIFTLILPTWVVVIPAYDPDPQISSVWSPRDAIVERYTQIGFTLAEVIVGGVYIYSLLGLLQHKTSVRQRRVMSDLIYVNVLAILTDVVCVVLVYLNQLGLSHPIQTFSYLLKLKLEFLVLNQLMAVAARGYRRRNWEDKRYHRKSTDDTFSAEARKIAQGEQPSPQEPPEAQLDTTDKDHFTAREMRSRPMSLSMRSFLRPDSSHQQRGQDYKVREETELTDHSSTHTTSRSPANPKKASLRLKKPHGGRSGIGTGGQDESDAEEEEIPVHLWERRGGELMLAVPWLEHRQRHRTP